MTLALGAACAGGAIRRMGIAMVASAAILVRGLIKVAPFNRQFALLCHHSSFKESNPA
jgi:hypothetical protein